MSLDLITSPDFHVFNKIIFPKLALLNCNQNAYNLQTRCSMFKLVSSSMTIPGKEIMTKTTTSVFGTTVLGGVSIVAYMTGQRVDNAVEYGTQSATKSSQYVLNNVYATDQQRAEAIALLKQAKDFNDVWTSNQRIIPSTVKGFRFFAGESNQTKKLAESLGLSKQGNDLVYRTGMEEIKKTPRP